MSDIIILTVNSGSTSVKLAAFRGRVASGELELLARERLDVSDEPARDMLSRFVQRLPDQPIGVVAHRVVHGGTRFTRSVKLDPQVEAAIDELSRFAPLHNPPALQWIAETRAVLGGSATHVAVFDTAFFARLPPVAAQYAVPASWSEKWGIRRYGFHGIAHEMMWRRWRELYPDLPQGGRLITLQLGGGCSITAIDRGLPVETSMGFSPLEGLVMATRSGDIDPAVVPYLARCLDAPAERVVDLLNQSSGLKGVSRRTSNLGELIVDPAPDSQLAVEMYCHRARKYVGAYLAVLGGCDGIVFGGGVGENVPEARERILRDMQWAGIDLDPDANAATRGCERRISMEGSVPVYVIPVDEESALARAALEFV